MDRLALLSVSDKTGIVEFAQGLAKKGFRIVSTGGTQKTLTEAGIAVMGVEELTQFPECLSGRVKTLHPMIAGGILFRRGDKEHQKQAAHLHMPAIDLVCVNLYPFRETVAQAGATRADAVEQIDIGGPTLLRAAAKNAESVTVVCDPADYGRVLTTLDDEGAMKKLRADLAAKIFAHTAAYDAAIAQYLSDGADGGVLLTRGRALRYGENPHQWGKFYTLNDAPDRFIVHQGKELSYLNLLDADGAWNAVVEFSEPTVVMVKHANPSGIASRPTVEDAFQAAYDADRLSAFGVIIAMNRPCTRAIVEKIIDQKMFVEIVLAPAYEPAALEKLKGKPNIRVLEMKPDGDECRTVYRSALCGMLVQELDTRTLTEKDLTVVTKKKPAKTQTADLLFAWTCVKHSKSNAVVFAKNATTIGIGAGQTSRVDATWIAARRAGENAKGAVMASDAFFPFPDALEEAAKVGIAAVIQPGGSIRDDDVIRRADELGLVMVTTGVRAFWH